MERQKKIHQRKSTRIAMEKNPTATNLKDMDTRRKPTDTDINLILLITPMATIPTVTKSQCMADMTTTDTSQPMADITRILTEDTVEVIRRILTEDMVEVIQKILTVEVYKRIHTGDMAEIKLIRTEDMEAVTKNNITGDMVADTRLVHMVTAI